MCGLAGFVTTSAATAEELCCAAERMAATLVHRGPDDAGTWCDAGQGVALAFRRLSVLDLTPSGHQPMVSANGRLAIVFNGEIYNFRELRADLEAAGVRLRGGSDTEVIVETAARWGVREAIARLWGMFAIALWDSRDRTLVLARDRVGKKPLYLCRQGTNTVMFASELKALRAHPSFRAEVDRESLADYLRLGYIPSPRSIYRGVTKLEPGCLAVVRCGHAPEIERYWHPGKIAADGLRQRRTWADEDARASLETLLLDAVSRRTVADVPVGLLLSGGVDSAAVAALMQQAGTRPARTFTVGFEDAAFDEATQARAVARHLGTEHTELTVTAAEARDVIPRLPTIYDEPFADASAIPTCLVSSLARRSVTVALSGDGGDEVFGGYVRYLWAPRVWRALAPWPGWLRSAARWAIEATPDSALRLALAASRGVWPLGFNQRHPVEKIRKLASVLDADSPEAIYERLITHWPARPAIVIDSAATPRAAGGTAPDAHFRDAVDQMMYRDLVGYLPDDILTKVDRASMSVSLEVRNPLLDHRLVEWAWSLPSSLKIRHGSGKWLLRQVLYRHVPPALVDRPKSGFAVPIGHWLRGPLYAWAEALLDEDRLRREGYFRPEPIRRLWRHHLSGRGDEHRRLWVILMFQAWLERWRP